MRAVVDGRRNRECNRAGEVAGDHHVGDRPTPLHVFLAQAPGLVRTEHQRIAPWRVAQKSVPKELDTPICWCHCIDFLLLALWYQMGLISEAETRGSDLVPGLDALGSRTERWDRRRSGRQPSGLCAWLAPVVA